MNVQLTTEQQGIWEKLEKGQRFSLANRVRHDPEDLTLESPGIYAIWNANEILYIGCALMTRPADVKAKRLWGLKDRIDSHQRGQISGSSLALAAWFCKIAPNLSVEDHAKIAAHKLNPSAKTEEYIRGLSYSCVPTLNAGLIEAALYRAIKPPFNEFQEFVRKDRLSKTKKAVGV